MLYGETEPELSENIGALGAVLSGECGMEGPDLHRHPEGRPRPWLLPQAFIWATFIWPKCRPLSEMWPMETHF